MPAKNLPRALRFKLEMVAMRHKVSVKGYSTAEVVVKIIQNGELSATDRAVLVEVCVEFGYDFKEIETMAKGGKK